MNKPSVSLIWAEDNSHLIGKNSGLPWRLSADMAWFRSHTIGKPILMGRKTHESIGRALPERLNLVQSRHHPNLPDDCIHVTSMDDALKAATGAKELMVMGGAEIYRLWLPRATRLYVTHIDAVLEGDVYFPPLDWQPWQRIYKDSYPASPDYAYRFCIYEKH
ncbi:MAG: dihydrofolate reductase [Mariprofundaceae bacterium]|nr:dihydrofolate reductase [Mariprofundaceae bacterium]